MIDPKTGKEVSDKLNVSQVNTAAPITISAQKEAVIGGAGTTPTKTETPISVVQPIGSKGAYNKFTGGYETVNPTQGVNAGTYSPQQKSEAVKALGYELKPGMEKVGFEKIQDAFYRKDDQSIGVKEDVLTPYFQKKGTVTTPPTKTITGQGVGTSLTGDSLDSYNKLTPQEKSYYDSLIAKGELSKVISDLSSKQKEGTELKYGKDVSQAMQDLDASKQIQLDSLNLKYDREIEDAANKTNKLIDNSNYFRGAVGFPQTQIALKAQTQNIDRAKQLVQDIKTTKDLLLKESNLEYAAKLRELQEQLDSNVSSTIQKQLVNLGLLAETGKLDTIEGINKARSDLLETLNNDYANLVTKNSEAQKFILDKWENNIKSVRESNKFDDKITGSINDGYLYSVSGTRMADSYGNPIKSNPDKQMEQVMKNDDGSTTILYKDGTFETKKFGSPFTEQAIDSYASLLAAGKISLNDIPVSARSDVATVASKKGFTPEAKDFISLKDADGNEYQYNIKTGETISGQDFGGSLGGITGSGTTSGLDFRQFASKYPKEASLKNNNPAGLTYNETFANTLKEAGIKFSVGTNRPLNEQAGGLSYFGFPDIKEGLKAFSLLWSLPSYQDKTVGQALSRWGTGELPGINKNKLVSQLTDQELDSLQILQLKKESPGMYKELSNKGIIAGNTFDLSKLSGEQAQTGKTSFTATEEALLSKYLKDPSDKATKNEMKKFGLSSTDADYFSSNKPKTTALTDDQRVIFNSQLSSFRGNPVIKAYEEQAGQLANSVSSLSAKSGPGDIAAIFQFMKTLDPTSVVREAEFNTAAASAGVLTQASNILQKLESGKLLDDQQRDDFKKLMEKYVENKANQYDRLYGDFENVLQLNDIPKEYLPKKATADLITSKKRDEIQKQSLEATMGPGMASPQDIANYGRWSQSQSSGGNTTQGRWSKNNQQ